MLEFQKRIKGFPTNPINALEARGVGTFARLTVIGFPTNPINALEASVTISIDNSFDRIDAFPTNPINALEASIECPVGLSRPAIVAGFQLIQLTHWKRASAGAKMMMNIEFLGVFPTNPINALEASLVFPPGAVIDLKFPTNPINALEASALSGTGF